MRTQHWNFTGFRSAIEYMFKKCYLRLIDIQRLRRIGYVIQLMVSIPLETPGSISAIICYCVQHFISYFIPPACGDNHVTRIWIRIIRPHTVQNKKHYGEGLKSIRLIVFLLEKTPRIRHHKSGTLFLSGSSSRKIVT